MRDKILAALATGRGLPKGVLFKKLGLRRRDAKSFYETIDDMLRTKQLAVKQGRLVLPRAAAGAAKGVPTNGAKQPELVRATVVSIHGTFGFARLESGEEVFLPGRYLGGAMPGEQVMLRVKGRGDRLAEGEVRQVLDEGGLKPFLGTLERVGKGWQASLQKGRMILPVTKLRANPKEGDRVLLTIDRRGATHEQHTLQVMQDFGDSSSAKSCIAALVAEADVPTRFSDDVLAAAQKAERMASPIHERELAARLDLRGQQIFTIDSADSKDLDDAISLERDGDDYILGVHIADVSYFVQAGDMVDTEAYARGTSIYYADTVIPMLPQALSNGICSLNEGEDRLAFSVFIRLDNHGDMLSHRLEKSVIRSVKKGVYAEINSIFSGSATQEVTSAYAPLMGQLTEMQQLASTLIRRRAERGGLDLTSTESKIILGEDGVAIDIKPREQGFTEQLIEEFMLLANQATAAFAVEHELPFLYRVHDAPSPEKIETLRLVLQSIGQDTAALSEGATPHALYAILQAVKGRREEKLVNNTLLRSMAKAKYSENNTGHFGLVMKKYAHFTSPIRRYPDLFNHRVLSAYLSGMRRGNIESRYRAQAAQAAAQSSTCEVRAMQLERSCEACYKAEYMGSRIGESFAGVVSSVMGFGIYVELPTTVEGLVRVERLPGGQYTLKDPTTIVQTGGKLSYRVGDDITVTVLSVNVASGEVDFALTEVE